MTTRRRSSTTSAGCGGIGIGNVIAALLSWSYAHDILWTAIHAFFGWFYVIYYLFGGR
jgi:hypothetical protein